MHSSARATSHSSRSVRRIPYSPENDRTMFRPSNPLAPVINILFFRSFGLFLAIRVPPLKSPLHPDRPDSGQPEGNAETGLVGPGLPGNHEPHAPAFAPWEKRKLRRSIGQLLILQGIARRRLQPEKPGQTKVEQGANILRQEIGRASCRE